MFIVCKLWTFGMERCHTFENHSLQTMNMLSPCGMCRHSETTVCKLWIYEARKDRAETIVCKLWTYGRTMCRPIEKPQFVDFEHVVSWSAAQFKNHSLQTMNMLYRHVECAATRKPLFANFESVVSRSAAQFKNHSLQTVNMWYGEMAYIRKP